tara:strand:- start:261 stop:638 length:378 start_codon:yes stop_codon:yes gene_type:complete
MIVSVIKMSKAWSVKVYFDEETWNILENLKIYDSKGKELSRSQKIRSMITNKLGNHQADNFPMHILRKRLHRISLFMSNGVLETEPKENLSQIEIRYLRALELIREFKREIVQHAQYSLAGWDVE